MSSEDSSSHAYMSLPQEDVPSTLEKKLPSIPQPHLEDGFFQTYHTITAEELSKIKRNMAEINNILASLKLSTGGIDPENFITRDGQKKPLEFNWWQLSLALVIFILIVLFFIWFIVYLNIWYENSTEVDYTPPFIYYYQTAYSSDYSSDYTTYT
ncbi:hypothetical protein DFJ63DRAFT_336991 [Scheffersomyces coipomensis]|uniref:uncharacterized protein n=1 Tax=Scheffersomyces coipomensis TaxID=1788519 RepID=UPI00315DA4A6